MFQVAMFAWALLGFAGVYAATARRAFDDTVQRVHTKQSVALTRSMAYHPEVQHQVAEIRIHIEALTAHLDRACDDWSNGVDHGMEWPAKILACKYDLVTRAWVVVDTALDLSGGAGIFKRSRVEQLFRDARLGRIHPGNTLLTSRRPGQSMSADIAAQLQIHDRERSSGAYRRIVIERPRPRRVRSC